VSEQTSLSELTGTRFDLIVIGAGINGVAIARDAAMRGLQVAVLDKSDIGSGTTSWSTRLIHGGLRYLEYREFGLVRESLRERERLLRNAPHLVQPLPMFVPIFAGAKRGPLLIRAGMTLYDVLSYDKSLPRHHMLTARQTLEQLPGLHSGGLKGAARFFDAQAPYAERLAVENALSAHEHGAKIVTQARIDRIVTEGAVVRGVVAHDLLNDQSYELAAKTVVNVTGPWVDRLLESAANEPNRPRFIGGTKGSHLVVPPFPGAPTETVYFEAKSDGRAIFIIPWTDRYLIGSTDVRYDGDLDDVRISEDEIDYLLSESNRLIPTANLSRDDVQFTYSGVRPLPYVKVGAAGAITRRHLVQNHSPRLRGLLSVIGGKLTTHRSLAEEVVDEVCDQLGISRTSPTANLPFPGAAGIALAAFRRRVVETSGLPERVASRLVSIYGGRATEVLALADNAPDLRDPFDPESGAIGAEVVFAVRTEFAHDLQDILMRRTMVGLGPTMGVGADLAAAAIAQQHLGWSSERAATEVGAYRSSLERFRPRVLSEME
jgi:glycerol-3-phosphate dehydrogenase